MAKNKIPPGSGDYVPKKENWAKRSPQRVQVPPMRGIKKDEGEAMPSWVGESRDAPHQLI